MGKNEVSDQGLQSDNTHRCVYFRGAPCMQPLGCFLLNVVCNVSVSWTQKTVAFFPIETKELLRNFSCSAAAARSTRHG